MNRTALWIGIGYAAFVAVSLILAFLVWRSTRSAEPALDEHVVEKREVTWFWVVLVALAALLAVTILDTPWRARAAPDRQIVHVTGFQFAWRLDPPGPYQAGRQIEFNLTSADVNHGFAIYGPGGDFIAQAQVIPQHHLLLRETLTKPGTYTVRCFEYCGLYHHQMETTFQVTS
jgi:cytochrome c oxidase subunit 2